MAKLERIVTALALGAKIQIFVKLTISVVAAIDLIR